MHRYIALKSGSSFLSFKSYESPLGAEIEPLVASNFSSLPWKDLMRTSAAFALVDSVTLNPSSDPVNVDDDGYPTSLPANRYMRTKLVSTTQYFQYGNYVALYDGVGTLGFDWDASSVVKTAEGRYTFIVNSFANGIRMLIKTTTPGNYVRNIRVIPAEFETDLSTNQWHPNFLENLSPYGAIRFMNWMRVSYKTTEVSYKQFTGSSPTTVTLHAAASAVDDYYNGMLIYEYGNAQRRLISDYDGTTKIATVSATWSPTPSATQYFDIFRLTQQNWEDRTTGTFHTQYHTGIYGGTSVEVMVDLANKARCDPWFCMPAEATDDYVRQFATYVYNNLDNWLKIYVEYSNETWNSTYPGFDYCTAKGSEIGINRRQYHAYRATQMHQIWSDVFGEQYLRTDRTSSRIIRILGSHADTYSIGIETMDYDGTGLHAGVSNPFAAGKAAHDYADALAIAMYVGSSDILPPAYFDTYTPSQLLAIVSDEIDGQTLTRATDNCTNARTRGMDLVAYEGGQEMRPDSGTSDFTGDVKSPTLTTITIDSWVDWRTGTSDVYNGSWLSITSGVGSGQDRIITDYDAPSLTMTVAAWDVIPTTSSKFLVRSARNYKTYLTNKHPDIKGVYLKLFNMWRNVGVDVGNVGCKLFSHFQLCGSWSQQGYFGAKQYYNQDDNEMPKVQAIKEFTDTYRRWWTR